MDELLHSKRWKGQNTYTLYHFVQSHRNAYISMEACAAHVQHQLPTQHTRVGYILDAIENDDAGLQAAMANVRDDKGANGKRNDFERAVAHLLPADPVAKKRRTAIKKAGLVQISVIPPPRSPVLDPSQRLAGPVSTYVSTNLRNTKSSPTSRRMSSVNFGKARSSRVLATSQLQRRRK